MRSCASCTSPFRQQIDAKIRQGTPFTDISLWLASKGNPATRNAISRHARSHVGTGERAPGPRPMSGKLLEKVIGAVEADLDQGTARASVRDGIAAQAELNRQAERTEDRDLFAKLTVILTRTDVPRLEDPERDAIEAEIRELTAGESSGATPIPVDIRVKPAY